MRLHPFQTALIGLALFWAGLLLALMLLHGRAAEHGDVVFPTPF
jgi:hypothetical protein